MNEVCAIYPITPSSTMAELADEWSAQGLTNIWGNVPVVQEMQSEGGAAGAVHGALQSGAMTTTFTASQGLMLMLPNMFKIAGELTATVFHVAARALATQALSIFGDHSDVMATRTTGFALLSSASVQEAHDGALIAQAATLEARVPFLHFFDGFRTSHELNKVTLLSDAQIRAMIRQDLVRAHRDRALNPEHPFIRGTAHNPDTFFQARETVNPYYARTPEIVQAAMDRFAALTGRAYKLFEYEGPADAERVIVLMGSGAETARETAAVLQSRGERVGVLQVRLYRPFAADAFLAALPESCRAIAVLEQAKEPGAPGEPLYLDVVTTLAQALATGKRSTMPRVIGGRYGLGSKNFNPAQVKAVFDALAKPDPRHSFTVGIEDDVSHTNLALDPTFSIERDDVVRALFFGLGADGTVGANKNSVKIIAEDPAMYAQGYFVYDSHKSGAQTVSHLRFGKRPIHAPYLIESANFVACHQASFLGRIDVLRQAAPGATFLLNIPYGPDEVWNQLPRSVQTQILAKKLRFYVIDASRVAREAGLGNRINTVLQTCFFAISGVLPRDQAIARIKHSIEESYGDKGGDVVRRNFQVVDDALAHLHEVRVPDAATSGVVHLPLVPDSAPPFVREVIAQMMAGRGDDLRVGQMPVDGTFPSGTAAFEKRNVSDIVAVWDQDLCVQCGQCGFACPHSVIRGKYYDERKLDTAPPTFKSASINARGYPDVRFTLQLYVEDCTGCGICVEVCPESSPRDPGMKAINLAAKAPILEQERANIAFFESLPMNDRARVDFGNVRGVQFLQPLFEFSGACAGCGETPYLKLLSQLFGDRLQIANATGCSSIYGGNLPVTPWTKDEAGRGPAWSNSLFEDNAEFGLGFRLAADKHLELARTLLRQLAPKVGEELVRSILEAPQERESELRAQRSRVEALKQKLASHRRRDRPRSALRGRSPDPAQHLDRGRGRLGLRHRLRRARSRPRLLPRRQRAGARHRGLLQHRRSGVEGDAAGRGREVRGRRQARGAQGSGAAGDRVRQRLRRAGGDGREPAAHVARLPRGGGLSGTGAHPRLQSLHRPWLRPAARHEATGPGGRQRSLAAVPFQSGHAHRGRAPLPAGLAAADDPAQGLRLQGAALPHARANRSRGGAGAAGRGPADRDREVPAIRGAGQPRRRDLQSRRHPSRAGVGRPA